MKSYCGSSVAGRCLTLVVRDFTVMLKNFAHNQMRRAFHGMCHPKAHHHHHLLHLQARFMQHHTAFICNRHSSQHSSLVSVSCLQRVEGKTETDWTCSGVCFWNSLHVVPFASLASLAPTCPTFSTCSHLPHLAPYGPTCPSCSACPNIVFMHRLPLRRDLGSRRGQCDRGGFACFSLQRERDQVRQVGLLREVEQVAKAPSSGTSGTRGYFKKQTP